MSNLSKNLDPKRVVQAEVRVAGQVVQRIYSELRWELRKRDYLPDEVVALFDHAITKVKSSEGMRTALAASAILGFEQMKLKFIESDLYKSAVAQGTPISSSQIATPE